MYKQLFFSISVKKKQNIYVDAMRPEKQQREYKEANENFSVLHSVFAKYRDLSVSCRSINLLLLIIDPLATEKLRYFGQPRPIIVNYSEFVSQLKSDIYLPDYFLATP